jgi:chemotaxis signal transduction protein
MEAAGINESPAARPVGPIDPAGRGANPDCLTLRAGDALWAVPMADILCIADSAADPAPLPHPPAAVEGLVAIEGRAFVQMDLAAALGAPARGRRPGGAVVVVARGAGGVALRVDAVTRDTAAPRLAIDDLIPWARGGAARTDRPFPGVVPVARAAPVPLLLVASGGTNVALPIGRIERVGKVDSTQALRRDGTLALVRVDDALLPARRLADTLPTTTAATAGDEDRWAVVLRGDDDAGAALTVDRVLGLEPCDAQRIATVTLPTGETQRWLNCAGAEPIRVLDAAGLFGWPSPVAPPSPSRRPTASSIRREALITAQAGDIRVALPLDRIDRVLDPELRPSAHRTPGAIPVFDAAVAFGRRAQPRAGTVVRVRLDGGGAALLSFDRVLALSEPPSPWQAVEPLPPAAGALFDAVCRDQTDTHWLFRLRHAVPAHPLPKSLLRCLAATRLGWVPSET